MLPQDFNRIIGALLKNVAANMKSPFIFSPFHKALRGGPSDAGIVGPFGPFDYYRWAQSFMVPASGQSPEHTWQTDSACILQALRTHHNSPQHPPCCPRARRVPCVY